MASRVIPFNRCYTTECTRIQIVNDLVLEGDELFDVSVETDVEYIEVNPSHATVRIYGDNDSKLYMIGYKEPSNWEALKCALKQDTICNLISLF